MGGSVKKAVGSITGANDAKKASEKGAATQAAYQQKALDYLKETERLPQAFRESALAELAGRFGLSPVDDKGEPIEVGAALPTQAERIALAQESPYYNQLMGSQQAGEEAIMRNAAMTGGLRSGNVQHALYDYNTQLQQKALTDAYNQQIAEENRMLQGLGGLAQLPSMAGQIAQQQSNIGQTLAQGRIGGQQSANAANQSAINTALQAGALFALSDKRLKTDIEFMGERNGHNWYRWKWNDVAKDALGLEGTEEGVMAQEVQLKRPDAVYEKDGYLAVNYKALGVERD